MDPVNFAVAQNIKRLREKLPDCEKYGWEIHTVWRVGYKFDYKPA